MAKRSNMKHLYYPMNITFPSACLEGEVIFIKNLSFGQAKCLEIDKLWEQVEEACQVREDAQFLMVSFPCKDIECNGDFYDLSKAEDNKFLRCFLYALNVNVLAIAYYSVFCTDFEIIKKLTPCFKASDDLALFPERIVLKRKEEDHD